ncbi:MAG TPA: secondary thiamine-phosphate synthase enzyme YjbQ [bacterium]|nr:secondary thiamine-phosphate synthase enzyme YjbQ [bacterium]
MFKIFSVKTGAQASFSDITPQVAAVVSASKIGEGICVVTVPHTTAGLTVNENADPSVQEDIITALDKLVPVRGPYRHSEGNSHAHVKSSLLGHSHILHVSGGSLKLGTWQGIFLCEFDGPRTREVHVSVIPA